jgi:putative aldouronate transport system permease protein
MANIMGNTALTTRPTARPGGRWVKSVRKYWQIYVILLASAAFFFIFDYIPMYGVTMAFREYRFDTGMFRSPWIGLEYFRAFFGYFNFSLIIRNTLVIGLFQIIIYFPIPIIFAFMLNEVRSVTFKRVIQTLTYLPFFISWVVVLELLQHFLSLDGLLNQFRVSIGLEKVFYMNSPDHFYGIMFLSFIWKNTGMRSIIYLAALSGVDPQLYEAADVEGAGRLRKMWSISLPSIAPTVVMLFILSLAQMLRVGWEQIYLLRMPGNMHLADVIDTYVIQQGLQNGQFGYATAVSLFQGVIGLLLVLATNAVAKRVSELSLF